MSTFGTVLAYCLPMYDTIQIMSAGLLLHKWTSDGLVYVLPCDIGWAKWALSIGLSLCTLTVDRCVRWLRRAEQVWLYRAPCFELLLEQLPLYWLLIFVQYGEVDNLTNSSKNLSRSNCIIVVQICVVITKMQLALKLCYFDNCERSEEMRGLWAGWVYQRTICYTPCIAVSLFCTTTLL